MPKFLLQLLFIDKYYFIVKIDFKFVLKSYNLYIKGEKLN